MTVTLTADEHLKRAKYNEDFARYLGGAKSKWPSWTVTALFYAALHQADALLEFSGQEPTGHGDRNNLLLQWPDLRRPYMRLFQYSHEARYDAVDHPSKNLQHALDLLDDVKSEVKAQLP